MLPLHVTSHATVTLLISAMNLEKIAPNQVNDALDDVLRVGLKSLNQVLMTKWLIQTESTNDEVKALISQRLDGKSLAVVADFQTKGKGTHGRVWKAPKASLLLTVGVPIDYPIVHARGLTLAVGVEVVDILRQYNQDVKLKWPNDIWIDGRKVCGISCETAVSADKTVYVVVGIGINIALDEQEIHLSNTSGYVPGALFREVPDMKTLTKTRLDLAIQLIRNCRKEIAEFSSNHLEQIRKRWPDIDALNGQKAQFTKPDGKVFIGWIDGLDQYGQLKFTDDRATYTFVDGTLRPLICDKEKTK